MVWLPHWPVIGRELNISLGLARIKYLMEALGSPHLRLPPTIHVTGTNGKGSTVAFMKAILEEAGLKVHRYISPHMIRFNERILLAGNEIEDEYLYSLLEECRIATERHDLDISFFEGITAAAFLAFSRVPADVLLLEVGLGGRLDATNVIRNPMISVITPISYDHEKILGPSIEKIAFEKAGIIKPGRPCIVSMQNRDVHDVISLCADRKKANVIQYEYDFGVSKVDGMLEYRSNKRTIVTEAPTLPGYHQYINAATAIAALDHCYSFPDEIFKVGVPKAKWLGRLTKIETLAIISQKNCELWVDGSHNAAAGQAVAAWLADQPFKETILIFGMTKNRDVNSFLRHFKGLVNKIITVNIQSEPCSYNAERIIELLTDKDLKDIATPALTVDEALEKAVINKNSRIIIVGSLFLASDFFTTHKSVRAY